MERTPVTYKGEPKSQTLAVQTWTQILKPDPSRTNVSFFNEGTVDCRIFFTDNPWACSFVAASSDEVDVPHAALAASATGSVKMMLRIHTTGIGSRMDLWNVSIIAAQTYMGAYIETTGVLKATYVVGGTASWAWASTSALPTNEWIELKIVHNGVTPSFYLNGQELAGSFTTSTNKTKWFSGGASWDEASLCALNYNGAGAANFFDGEVDRWEVWDKLESREPRALLIGYHFTEGTGTTLDNIEGTAARDGTLSRAAWATRETGELVKTLTGLSYCIHDHPEIKKGLWAYDTHAATTCAVTTTQSLRNE